MRQTGIQQLADFLQIGFAKYWQNFDKRLWRQIPPAKLQEKDRQFFVKSSLNQFSGVATKHGVWRNVFGNHRVGSDDRPVPDFYTGHDDAFPSDPNIVSDDRIPLMGELGHMRRRMLAPCATKDMERIGRHAADAVVCRPHNEFCTGRDRAKPSYDEFVAKLGIVEKNIVFS